MTDLRAARLQALARSMLDAGSVDIEDVEQLTRRALKDGALQPEERTALEGLLNAHGDRFENGARDHLTSFLAITDEELRCRFHALETDDGKVDVFDALELQKLAAGTGPIADPKRYSVAALMVGCRMDPGGELLLERLAAGETLPGEVADFLRDLNSGRAKLEDGPRLLMADHRLLGIAAALQPAELANLPEALREDPEVQIAALGANPAVFRYLPKPITNREVMVAALSCNRNDVGRRLGAAASDLLDDRELVRFALQKNPWALKAVSERYGADREMVEYAVALGCPLRVVDESLLGDRGVALAALAHDSGSFRYLSQDLRQDREIALAAVKSGLDLRSLGSELRDDREIVLAAIGARGGDQLQHTALRDDRDLALAAVKSKGSAFRYLGPTLRADDELARLAVAQDPSMYAQLSDQQKSDRELALLAVSHPNRRMIGALPAQLLKDREILLTAMTNNRSAYRSIPDLLRNDRGFMFEAVALCPEALALAGPALQRDRELVLTAATRAGRNGSLEIDETLLADRDFLTQILAVHPHSLEDAPDGARGDRDLVGPVVLAYPEALAHAADEIRNDRDFVAPLIERSGAYIKYAGHALRDDRELAERALVDHPYAFSHLSRRLGGDRELALLAVRRNGKVYESLSAALKKDVALITAAVRYYGDLMFEHIPEELRDHPEVVKAALISSPALVSKIPSRFYFSDELIRSVAERNPLIFDYFPSRRRSLPALARAYDQLKKQIAELEIDFPQRLRPVEVLREVIRNRTEPRAADDDRPLALFVFPKSDHNGAFEINSIAEMMSTYRVVYHEAETDTDLEAVLKTTADDGDSAEVLVIAGHGTREFTSFGAADPAKDENREREAGYLDLSDGEQLRSILPSVVSAGGHIILQSCSTGEGRGEQENIANFVAKLAPQASVYAPTHPTNSQFILDEDGRFEAPGYWRGSEETYIVSPKR